MSLQGKRVMVTRPEGQGEDLAARLAALGAIPVLAPAIEIEPLRDTAALDQALRSLEYFDWVVLTSVNGVAAVRSRMEALGIGPEALASRKLAAIGPTTAAALESFCRAPDLVPAVFVSEAIADGLQNVEGLRFLLLRADLARKDLAELLRERRGEVLEIAAYHIKPNQSELNAEEQPDVVVLTSSAGAAATIDRFEAAGRGSWLRQAALVSIGPITSATISSRGYAVAATAEPYTAEGLLTAIKGLEAYA